MSAPRRWCATADAAAHVFVERLADDVTLEGADGHHLQRVRRLRAGERITAADGSGAWRTYVVSSRAPGSLALDALDAGWAEPELQPTVTVAPALTKRGLDVVVAQCTEVGVVAVEPVLTQHGVVRPDPQRSAGAVERWRAIAREAAAQSRRARIPTISPPVPLAEMAARRGLVLADRDGVGVAALGEPAATGWIVCSGPEGGFSDDERAQLGHAVRLRLSPHIVRAETAPVVAAAVLVHAGWADVPVNV